MSKVYLETSYFSACVTTRQDARSVYWREQSLDWWANERARHVLCVSDEVIAELSDPQFPQREAAPALLQGLALLEIDDAVRGLAEVLTREQVVPGPANAGDAIHLAVATVHAVDYVLSWNVRHLANPNKRTHLAVVCLRFGLTPPIILTPDTLKEPGDDPT